MPRPSMDSSEIADQAALTRQAEGWLPMQGWTGDQVDWSTVTGGGGIRHANEQAYLDWLYGPGGQIDSSGEEKFYRPAGGAGSFLPGRTPMQMNPKDSPLAKILPAAWLMLATAGMGGMLPGVEGITGAAAGSGAAAAGGMSQAELAALIESGTAGAAGAGLESAALAGNGLTAAQMATLTGGGSLSAPFNIQDLLTKIASSTTGGGGGGIPGMTTKSDPLSTGMNIVSGIYGLKKSDDMMKIAERAAAMQDPFGAQRPQYQAMLSQLMADPSKITSMPGYTAGMQAVERRLASQGYLGSGNMMAAMAEYGGSFFDKEANRLATLAGANVSPSGGNVLMNGANSSFDAASKALATLGFSVRDIARILNG